MSETAVLLQRLHELIGTLPHAHQKETAIFALQAIERHDARVRELTDAKDLEFDLRRTAEDRLGIAQTTLDRQFVIYGGAHAALTKAGAPTEEFGVILELPERIAVFARKWRHVALHLAAALKHPKHKAAALEKYEAALTPEKKPHG